MKNKKPKYVYWIMNGSGGLGEWLTLNDAKKSLKFWSEKYQNKNLDWKIVKKSTAQCPHCGRWTSKEDIDSLSMCLVCEKIMGDMMIEARGNLDTISQ